MQKLRYMILCLTLGLLIFISAPSKPLLAQDAPQATPQVEPADTGLDEEIIEEDMLPELPTPGEQKTEGAGGEAVKTEIPGADEIKGGEAREGETRWNVNITGAVVMNYTFNNSTDSFVVKYRWEVKGQANAATTVISGNADVDAEVEGSLSKWPTGECKLEISIPKIPFELNFKKTDESRGTVQLTFKRVISEDWESKCTFVDAPGRKFDTKGSPESWLAKALERARPPLKDIIAEMGKEESTTRFVITKDTITDPPLGTAEIEGTGVITIRPGGEE